VKRSDLVEVMLLHNNPIGVGMFLMENGLLRIDQ